MKRTIFFLIVLITCFNLAGGYAIAASVISQAGTEGVPSLPQSPHQHILKKATIDLRLVQVNKEDSEDDMLLPDMALLASSADYSYIPDFKLLNKHFLLHYGTSIKDKELAAYILHQNFRL
ncbi:hypothetical protein [Pontibacter russatus]|uniref:hypothetical protein n=1 Tax=Pontibacter russatus TaxID=2694929 RepID=UPI00137B4591|nr:hypothetical protein [Pontibacter russatus]